MGENLARGTLDFGSSEEEETSRFVAVTRDC